MRKFFEEYIDGGRFMAYAIEGFDRKHGTQHNFRTVIDLECFQDNKPKVIEYWAAVLTFDTILGNTDRHQDNWGIIVAHIQYGKNKYFTLENGAKIRLSPAFDNGTALTHEILEANFGKFDDAGYLLNYLTKPTRARHHMKWSLEEATPVNFYDFMKHLISVYPFVKERVLRHLNFSQSDLKMHLDPLTAIINDPPWRLTERRLEFTIRLLMKRRELLLKALSE